MVRIKLCVKGDWFLEFGLKFSAELKSGDSAEIFLLGQVLSKDLVQIVQDQEGYGVKY